MKRSELVKEVSKRLKIQRIECDRVIDAIQEVVTEALLRGEKVSIKGFITFDVTECRDREGFNPYTGEEQHFPSCRFVRCKIGKPIRDIVRGKQED